MHNHWEIQEEVNDQQSYHHDVVGLQEAGDALNHHITPVDFIEKEVVTCQKDEY